MDGTARTLTVEKGDSFQILPYDASISFQNAEGAKQGTLVFGWGRVF